MYTIKSPINQAEIQTAIRNHEPIQLPNGVILTGEVNYTLAEVLTRLGFNLPSNYVETDQGIVRVNQGEYGWGESSSGVVDSNYNIPAATTPEAKVLVGENYYQTSSEVSSENGENVPGVIIPIDNRPLIEKLTDTLKENPWYLAIGGVGLYLLVKKLK